MKTDTYTQNYDGFGKEWISASALSMLQMCGIAFEKRYILRQHEPSTKPIVLGLGAHKAREHNLTQKITSFVDLGADEVKDAARDGVHEVWDSTEVVPSEDLAGKSKDHQRAICADQAVALAAVDLAEFQCNIQPATVEESVCCEFEGLDMALVGRTDNDDVDGYVHDLKTGARAKSQSWCDSAQGLSTYGILLWSAKGVPPKGYYVENVVRGSKGIKTFMFETERTMAQLDRQLRRFAAAVDVIRKGAFVPCNPEEWKCSKQWCGYWGTCKYGGA